MNHLSDKELDRLSKEAAQQYDVEQNTSGWDQLHRKLNKELPEQGTRKRRRFLFLLFFFAFLTGGGIIYSYLNSPEQKIKNLQINKSETKNNSDNIKRETGPDTQTPASSNQKVIIPDVQTKKETSLATNNSEPKEKMTAPSKELTESGEPKTKVFETKTLKSQKQPVAVPIKDVLTGIQNISPKRKTPTTKGIQAKNSQSIILKSPAPAIGKEVQLDNKKNVVSDDEEKEEIIQYRNEQTATIKKQDETKPNLLSETAATENKVSAAQNNKTTPAKRQNHPFTIGLVAGPDLSNVNFRFSDKAGFNAGIRFSWQFAPRFSVSTGAVYTKKNYSALGRDYHPPKSYWTNQYTIDKVIGSCWMIDIPLEIRYDFHATQESKWFVSSGLSTYLMDKEDYEYHFSNNYGYQVRRWINEKNSNYILSVANISAGFEKMISKHLSVQAEPYLKIPLKGVGFGKMQMNSYGLNFSLRYGLSLKKQ